MKLCVIEGDGIGHEVVPAAVRVLRQMMPELEVVSAEAGWDRFQETGEALPEETVARAKEAARRLVRRLQFPLVSGRRLFLAHRQPAQTDGDLRQPAPDALSARADRARRRRPRGRAREYRRPLHRRRTNSRRRRYRHRHQAHHPRATERIAHTAFRLARNEKRRRVTIVHKGNVLPQTDGLFRRVAYEVAKEYSDIETDELLVDTAAYWMVKDPARFDVVLTPNLYGDILSDMAAAWGGGLGLAPALNIGAEVAIAEPIHGSAPDIAGLGIANPTAVILSAAMLARHHWNKPEIADRIDAAVNATLAKGDYTADILGTNGMSTDAFADIICEQLG